MTNTSPLKSIALEKSMCARKAGIRPEFYAPIAIVPAPPYRPVHKEFPRPSAPHSSRQVESAKGQETLLQINRLGGVCPHDLTILFQNNELSSLPPIGCLHIKQIAVISLHIRHISILPVDLVNQTNQSGTIFPATRAKNPVFLHAFMPPQITGLFKSQLP